MPIHDWKRVSAGDFHDFHQVWTGHIRTQLNTRVLPDGFYAQVEQQVSGVIPDVLTLHFAGDAEDGDPSGDLGGALAVATVPPRVQITAEIEKRNYAERKNRIVIHHTSEQRIVAIIELISAGNKSNEREFKKLIEKAVSAIEQGIHLLIVDLQPPTSRDPQGIHGAIWAELGEDKYRAPPGKPLTLVSYAAGPFPKAYVEPTGVGQQLIDMPLFLTDIHYVSVPLEETYTATFEGLPRHLKRILEEVR